jgi:unsaturated rhamnogalacturonyl hydrolase
VAEGLAAVYGQELEALTYIPGMALIGRLRLGQLAEVEAIVAPQLDSIEQLPINNSLQIAGHLLFAELAERTQNPRYLAIAQRAADLGFDAAGQALEAMPFHGEYSDAFFMATPLLAKVGKLSGDSRYFDLALRHVDFLQAKLQREDGLYNHWPRADAAWGRGNAFVALGLAMALSDLPQSHAAHARVLELFRALASTLLHHQDVDGMWHNVINIPGSWAELSATAMIATALQRGAREGWIEEFYDGVADRAWEGVLARTDESFGFIDVCESTPGQDSLDAYLNRRALSGRDDRAGGMLLYFAAERLEQ